MFIVQKLTQLLAIMFLLANFFLKIKEKNTFPQVPSCAECNNKKSVLEHYLTTILPFGGVHTTAKQNLTTMVPKRLGNNKKLHDILREETVYEQNKGVKRLMIPLDVSMVNELFKYIVKGLSWNHWNILIDNTYFVNVIPLTKKDEQIFEEFYFSKNPKERIENTAGGFIFLYWSSRRGC